MYQEIIHHNTSAVTEASFSVFGRLAAKAPDFVYSIITANLLNIFDGKINFCLVNPEEGYFIPDASGPYLYLHPIENDFVGLTNKELGIIITQQYLSALINADVSDLTFSSLQSFRKDIHNIKLRFQFLDEYAKEGLGKDALSLYNCLFPSVTQ